MLLVLTALATCSYSAPPTTFRAHALPPRAVVTLRLQTQKPAAAVQPDISSTDLVKRDLPLYGWLAALSLVPAADFDPQTSKLIGIVYFFLLATSSVYAGVLRQDLGEAAAITSKNAAAAPLVAGASLFGLYCLLKYTSLDPSTIYQAAACIFALVSSSELLCPLAGLLATNRLGDVLGARNDGANSLSEDEEQEVEDAGLLPSLIPPLLLLACYSLGPVSTGGALSLPIFAALTNVLACSIALSALGVLSLDSFAAGALLLGGLFCYDAFFVFKSDVMVTVATKIEAPAKFLWDAKRDVLSAAASGGGGGGGGGGISYPFSVLGLGDVVIPGAFVSLMRSLDLDQQAEEAARGATTRRGLFGGDRAPTPLPPSGDLAGKPYFTAALGAYAFGLGVTFAANYLTKAGQPALVYIVPSLLLASLATAAARGEVEALLAYRSSRAEGALAATAALPAAAREEKPKSAPGASGRRKK